MTVEQIKKDESMRPLFFELIGRNQICGLIDTFGVSKIDRIRLTCEWRSSLNAVFDALRPTVREEDILPLLLEVCREYMEGADGFAMKIKDPRFPDGEL